MLDLCCVSYALLYFSFIKPLRETLLFDFSHEKSWYESQTLHYDAAVSYTA